MQVETHLMVGTGAGRMPGQDIRFIVAKLANGQTAEYELSTIPSGELRETVAFLDRGGFPFPRQVELGRHDALYDVVEAFGPALQTAIDRALNPED